MIRGTSSERSMPLRLIVFTFMYVVSYEFRVGEQGYRPSFGQTSLEDTTSYSYPATMRQMKATIDVTMMPSTRGRRMATAVHFALWVSL